MKYILIISALLVGNLTHVFSQTTSPSGQFNVGTSDNNCSSFYPLPGEKYIVSCWVKESDNTQKKTYTNGVMEISWCFNPYSFFTYSEYVS